MNSVGETADMAAEPLWDRPGWDVLEPVGQATSGPSGGRSPGGEWVEPHDELGVFLWVRPQVRPCGAGQWGRVHVHAGAAFCRRGVE